MEKIIEIDILNEMDLIDKYDNFKMNNELLEYIIKKCVLLKRKDKIKIVIKNKNNLNYDFEDFFRLNFKLKYKETLALHIKNNIIQIGLLFLGLFFLFLSTQIKKDSIWQEVFLIGGWVPIWEMIDLELFNDVRGRKRKKILTKLINAQIEVAKK